MINQVIAMGPKAQKMGKYITTIDFDVFDVSKKALKETSVVGTFHIGNRTKKVDYQTLNEICASGNIDLLELPDCNRTERQFILDTILSARSVFFKKMGLGV